MHRGNLKEMADSGELSASSFAAEVTEVVAGKKKGRDGPDQRIVAARERVPAIDMMS
jgi:hypothetical protein